MNKSELIALVSKLYPKDMLENYNKFEHDDAKNMNPVVRPNASYFKIPVAYRLFFVEIKQMRAPIATVKSELKQWHDSLKFIKKTEKEASDPHTILDTSFYTPEYFDKAKAYANHDIKKIKDFAKNTLKSADQVYLIQQSPLSGEIHRYPLTKALVKLTVACNIFQKKHEFDKNKSGKYILGSEPLAVMPYYMHKAGVLTDSEYKQAIRIQHQH